MWVNDSNVSLVVSTIEDEIGTMMDPCLVQIVAKEALTYFP